MKEKGAKTLNFLLYFSLFLGLSLILAEYLLNLFGKTLCLEKGCEIVSLLTIFSKKTFLLIGMVYFLMLLIFIFLFSKTQGSLFLNLILLLLTGGLLSEGVFFLRQFLEYERLCLFCLLIASLLLAISLFFFLTLRTYTFTLSSILISLFGALLGLIISFYLTTEATINLSQNKVYLIYAEDCPRCKELMAKMSSPEIEKLPFYRIYPLFKVFQLKTVPILIEKSESTLTITTSYEEIAKKLLNSNKTQEDIQCKADNSTVGGLCELP